MCISFVYEDGDKGPSAKDIRKEDPERVARVTAKKMYGKVEVSCLCYADIPGLYMSLSDIQTHCRITLILPMISQTMVMVSFFRLILPNMVHLRSEYRRSRSKIQNYTTNRWTGISFIYPTSSILMSRVA